MISKSHYDWNAFKTLRNRVNCTIRKDKENYYKNSIHKSNDPKDAWKTINNILGRNQSKPTTCNLKVEGKDIEMPHEVTACFNDFFSGIWSKIADSVGQGNEFMTKATDTPNSQLVDVRTVLSDVAFNFRLQSHRTLQNSSQDFKHFMLPRLLLNL